MFPKLTPFILAAIVRGGFVRSKVSLAASATDDISSTTLKLNKAVIVFNNFITVLVVHLCKDARMSFVFIGTVRV